MSANSNPPQAEPGSIGEARLTKEQLKSITGSKRRDAIIRWLRAEGFTFRIDLNGWPIVHPEHYAQVMGVKGVKGNRANRPVAHVKLDHLR
jgi:hypothetical protein